MRRLSAARLNEYREAFRIFDKDGSGAISTRELKALMASVDQMCGDDEVEQMLQSVDADKSGEMYATEDRTRYLSNATPAANLPTSTPGSSSTTAITW